MHENPRGDSVAWWRHAVIYEVYPRSFADGNADGDGDLAGLRAHLGYLADLGLDGLWVAPWYPSPMADGGYDVSDFCDIHPMFGTLADADALLTEAHALGLKVIVDMVANHTSDQHPWFKAALGAEPGSPERSRYIFAGGRGEQGELPPNNWRSAFGGPAWTRLPDGQWYMHMFAPEQPDLNWANPEVLEAFDDVLRFWFDRGIDGLRIDAAPAFVKQPGLPDADYGDDRRFTTVKWVGNPHWDVEGVHDLFRRWRTLADSYGDGRIFVAEAIVNNADRLLRYVRPDELHTAFNFHYLKAGWDAARLRAVIDDTLASFLPAGVPPTWVLGSHDDVRLVSRFGKATTWTEHVADAEGEAPDLALGTRRARAAALLMLALPGGAYIYEGDELGLPHVDDLPDEVLQDPFFRRSGGTTRGRDGCRVPMPWMGDTPPFGFCSGGVKPWLPMPEAWAALTVEAQLRDPDSALSLYRAALRLRKQIPAFTSSEALTWRSSPEGVLDFDRGRGLRCVANISSGTFELGRDATVLLSSAPVIGGELPVDAVAWLGGTGQSHAAG
jgi:alpha-glucosidase